jgi:hypothetical protein
MLTTQLLRSKANETDELFIVTGGSLPKAGVDLYPGHLVVV